MKSVLLSSNTQIYEVSECKMCVCVYTHNNLPNVNKQCKNNYGLETNPESSAECSIVNICQGRYSSTAIGRSSRSGNYVSNCTRIIIKLKQSMI